jgi:hypothetical protein
MNTVILEQRTSKLFEADVFPCRTSNPIQQRDVERQALKT